jgi:hypothetical protein
MNIDWMQANPYETLKRCNNAISARVVKTGK